MLIRVLCPRCERAYQLDEDMVGKKIVCPNQMCRDIFVVEPAKDSPPPPLPESATLMPLTTEEPAPQPPQSGHVGNMVPIIEAEAVPMAEPVSEDESRPAKGKNNRPAAKSDTPRDHFEPPTTVVWQQEPPPQNKKPGKASKKRPKHAPETLQLQANEVFPVYPVPPDGEGQKPTVQEFQPGMWDAPPVRGESGSSDQGETPPTAPPEDDLDRQIAVAARKRRRRRLMIVGGLIFGIAAAVAVVLVLGRVLGDNEDQRFEQAKAEYQKGEYGAASDQLRKLADIPGTENKHKYEFLANLSDVRSLLPRVNPHVDEASPLLDHLIVGHETDPLVGEYSKDIWQAIQVVIDYRVQDAQTALADRHTDFARVKKDLQRAQDWLAIADKLNPKVPGSEWRQRKQNIDTQQQALAKAETRQKDLQQARAMITPASADNLKKLQSWIAERHYDLDEDFKSLIESMRQQVLRAVQYTTPNHPPATELPAEEPGLIIGLATARSHKPGDAVIFSLSRGVLFALRADDLSLLWFARVGRDTTQLPVRLPPSPVGGRAVLVLSSDTNTLSARDTLTGRMRWAQTLGSSPCVARPLVVDRVAYVPTMDGKVHAIETDGGAEIGQYVLGGRQLRVGGVRQPGTNLVYFAADQESVYALDVKTHQCVGILSTGHRAGTLQGEPIIISRRQARVVLGKSDKELPDYLVLSLTGEDGNTHLHAYKLPIQSERATQAVSVDPLPGIGSFAPSADPERMVQVTSSGSLAVLGIGQPGNSDPPLFVQSIKPVVPEGAPPVTERSQVVAMRDDDFWVLANGALNRWHYDVFRQSLVPTWDRPLALGAPLHAAETSVDGKTLYLTTQTAGEDTCQVTAVSAADGTILTHKSAEGDVVRLQKQIGFISQGELRIVNGKVMALDRGGALFMIDPARKTGETAGEMLGDPLPVSEAASYLLPTRDGQAVCQVSVLDRGPTAAKRGADTNTNRYQLLVRRYPPGPGGFEKLMDLDVPSLAGTPAIENGSVVIALTNAMLKTTQLRRYKLADGSYVDGPNPDVVSPNATNRVPVHVVAPADGDLLVSDGSATLRRYKWPGPGPAFNQVPSIELPAAAVGAPLLLPLDAKHPTPRVVVALANQHVIVLQGDKFDKQEQWTVPAGKVTSGPYVTADRVACVLDGKRLAWFDPNQDKSKVQSYRVGEDVDIVGQPQVASGMIVIADTGGQFIGLDPATGKVLREDGYTLKANVTPAAAPAPFGPDRVMTPLTDGTVFIMPLARLRAPGTARKVKESPAKSTAVQMP